jgi:chorismate dehydratase
LNEATAYNYLTKNLHFRIGPAERNGLRLFSKLAARVQLVPEGVELVFRDCAPA